MFTRALWHVDADNNTAPNVVDEFDRIVAFVVGPTSERMDRAKLIALAPEMYRLIESLNLLDRLLGQKPDIKKWHPGPET